MGDLKTAETISKKKRIIFVIIIIISIDIFFAQMMRVYKYYKYEDVYRHFKVAGEELDSIRLQVSGAPFVIGLRPNLSENVLWGSAIYSLKTNSLGFRDKAVRDVKQPAGGSRMVIMAASDFEGLGVPYEKTSFGLIEGHFAKCGVEFLNASIAALSPSSYERRLKWLIDDMGLEFDELVIVLGGDDAYNEAYTVDRDENGIISIGSPPKINRGEAYYLVDDKGEIVTQEKLMVGSPTSYIPPDVPSGAQEFSMPSLKDIRRVIRGNSLIYQVVWAARREIRLQRDDKRRLGLGGPDFFPGPAVLWPYSPKDFERFGKLGIERMKTAMDEIARFAKNRGVSLAIVVVPTTDDIYRRGLDNLHVKIWRKWAHENQVEFIDLFPDFITEKDPVATIESYYIREDTHWNEYGHAVVAQGFIKKHHLSCQ